MEDNKKKDLIKLFEKVRDRYNDKFSPDSPFKRKYKLLTLKTYLKINGII